MPYTKTAWVDDVTQLSAANLNKMEQGIADANAGVDWLESLVQPGVLFANDGKPSLAGDVLSIAGGAGLLRIASLLTYAPAAWGGPITFDFAASVRNLPPLVQVLVTRAANGAVTVVTANGPETAGTTLDNRSGAVTDAQLDALYPNGWLRLADVVPSSKAGNSTAFRDRRPWARGAYRRIVRNANDAGGNDYSTASAALVQVGTTLAPRIECSGKPMRMSLRARAGHNIGGARIWVAAFVDGAIADAGAEIDLRTTVNANEEGLNFAWDFVPTAGSHVLAPWWRTDQGASAYLTARASYAIELVVEEIMRQDAQNS